MIGPDAGKVLSQVDCQHRLGHLGDLPIPLPFMCFVGLSEREEMEVFNIINSKAKGLSTSLLDLPRSPNRGGTRAERPELFIALKLNSDGRLAMASATEPRRQDDVRPETDRFAADDAAGRQGVLEGDEAA